MAVPNGAVRLHGMATAAAAALLAAAVLAAGVRYGATTAGGSDSFGYVSESRMLASGRLSLPEPLMADESWIFGHHMLAPLGWLRAPDRQSIVPSYSPGYPLVMAGVERGFGPGAVYLVVPLLGAVAVLATYGLGTRHAGRGAGLIAAALLATSPTFLFQTMFPMSDVPATAWWTLALVLAAGRSAPAAAGAGVSAALAILTRPNLVPLAIVPFAMITHRAWRTRRGRGRWSGAIIFAAMVGAACLLVGWLNLRWYGSPLRSGYGSFDSLYAWSHAPTNLRQFGAWWLESQTAALLVALAAPVGLWRAGGNREPPARLAVPVSTVAIVLLSYLFYLPFDAWWYLRFLLPAFPALFVLLGTGMMVLLARLPAAARISATAVLVAALGWHGVSYSIEHGVFTLREGERKYQAVGEYVARRLPERAVLVAMQHSGSARLYSGRLTMRYDRIGRDQLDAVLDDLRGRGYEPYLLLESWEEPQFRAYYEEHSPLAALDWPPMAELVHASRVRLYDPRHRDARGPADRPPIEYFY